MSNLAALRREGMAEAVVLLVASRAVPPTATVGSLAAALGLTQTEMRAALLRVKGRTVNQSGQRLVRPETIPEGHKWCAWYGHVAPLAAFNRNASRRDGRSHYCRDCERERRAASKLGVLTKRPCPTNPERAGVRDVQPRDNAAQHGTRSMYVRGCGCEPCRAAQREYSRGVYERKKAQAA